MQEFNFPGDRQITAYQQAIAARSRISDPAKRAIADAAIREMERSPVIQHYLRKGR